MPASTCPERIPADWDQEEAMDKGRVRDEGWLPLQGSYEEAVLSWYEQIDLSFRRRELEAERELPEAIGRRDAGAQLPASHGVAD